MTLCPGLLSQYHKGKTNLDLLDQEITNGSGISWAICKSAPHPRPAPTTQFFTGWMPFPPSNQQHQSTAKTRKARQSQRVAHPVQQ